MRLIDADTIHYVQGAVEGSELDYVRRYNIDRMPTIDAVPVVRCKDCKHRDRYECNHIRLGETKCGVTDDWYCADGEREDDV